VIDLVSTAIKLFLKGQLKASFHNIRQVAEFNFKMGVLENEWLLVVYF